MSTLSRSLLETEIARCLPDLLHSILVCSGMAALISPGSSSEGTLKEHGFKFIRPMGISFHHGSESSGHPATHAFSWVCRLRFLRRGWCSETLFLTAIQEILMQVVQEPMVKIMVGELICKLYWAWVSPGEFAENADCWALLPGSLVLIV